MSGSIYFPYRTSLDGNYGSVCIKFKDKIKRASLKIGSVKHRLTVEYVDCDPLSMTKKRIFQLIEKGKITIVEKKAGVFALNVRQEDIFVSNDAFVSFLDQTRVSLEKNIGTYIDSALCTQFILFKNLDPRKINVPSFHEGVAELLTIKKSCMVAFIGSSLDSYRLVHAYIKNYTSGAFPIYLNLFDNDDAEVLLENTLKKLYAAKEDILENEPTIWFIQIGFNFFNIVKKLPSLFKDLIRSPQAKFVFILNFPIKKLCAGNTNEYFTDFSTGTKRRTPIVFKEILQQNPIQIMKLLKAKNLDSYFKIEDVMQILETIGMPLKGFEDYSMAIDAIPDLVIYSDIKSNSSLLDQWISAMSKKIKDRSKENLKHFIQFINDLTNLCSAPGVPIINSSIEAIYEVLNSFEIEHYKIKLRNCMKNIISEQASEFRWVLGIEYNPVFSFQLPIIYKYLKTKPEFFREEVLI